MFAWEQLNRMNRNRSYKQLHTVNFKQDIQLDSTTNPLSFCSLIFSFTNVCLGLNFHLYIASVMFRLAIGMCDSLPGRSCYLVEVADGVT